MHRRDLRRCLSVGVAPVRFLTLLLAFFSFGAAAQDYYYTTDGKPSTVSPSASGSAAAYVAYYPTVYNFTLSLTSLTKYNSTGQAFKACFDSFSKATGEFSTNFCKFVTRTGDACPTGQTFNADAGACLCPAGSHVEGTQCVTDNACTAKKDQATPYVEKFPSFDAYKATCKVSIDGCQVDTCSGPAATCGTDGKTGEFACMGSGSFTGEVSTGTDTPATTPPPPVPEPTTTSQDQSCTAPAVNGGTTTYTCQTDSNATEWASSNCAVGTVNGTQGLHCTKPDYVPEHDGKSRTDEVTEVTNPDGSKTKTTTSTTTTTHCAAGACNTTTNTTTTTSGTDANGNPTGTTTTCKGDNCDNPTTPGKDESEEEEDEEEGTATPFVPGEKGDYLPEIGGGDEAPTYAESLDDFTDRVSNAPIVRGLTSISVPTGGSCSMGSAQLFGGSVSFNDFCTMAPQVLAGLRYLFLAIWAWAAIRLFFTA